MTPLRVKILKWTRKVTLGIYISKEIHPYHPTPSHHLHPMLISRFDDYPKKNMPKVRRKATRRGHRECEQNLTAIRANPSM